MDIEPRTLFQTRLASAPPPPPPPPPPHICMIVHSNRAFTDLPRRLCSMYGIRAKGIEVAASCANRALVCTHGMTLLVIGNTAHTSAQWSVSINSRLHRNASFSAQLVHVAQQVSSALPRCPRLGLVWPPTKRHPSWAKVLLLLHGITLLPECDVLGVMDPDVLLMDSVSPLHAQPQIARWLASDQLLFISREPEAGKWARNSSKDFQGKNNLRNTAANCGFVLIKRGRGAQTNEVRDLLRRWWCAAEPDSGAFGDLGEPLSIYRQAWPMEGRAFHHTILNDPVVRLANNVNDYNTPSGRFVRHHWFKPNHNAAQTALATMQKTLCSATCTAQRVRVLTCAASEPESRGLAGNCVSDCRPQQQQQAVRNDCASKRLISYVSSQWEREWERIMNKLEALPIHDRDWRAGCKELHRPASRARIDKWLKDVRSPPSSFDSDVFSWHVVTDSCSGKELTRTPIEPLVGILRHPLAHCGGGTATSSRNHGIDKSYMLPLLGSQSWQRNGSHDSSVTQPRAFFFDMGASTYSSGEGGSSLNWFVSTYKALGVSFDRIFAWEAAPLRDEDIFRRAPVEVYDRISYYNLKVNATPGVRDNPLRVLLSMTSPDDLVVVKLDIDHPAVENSLISQILTNEAVSTRVDELFYEDHVQRHPFMDSGSRPWLRFNGGPLPTRTLRDSYSLFSHLRRLGIRAHSWV